LAQKALEKGHFVSHHGLVMVRRGFLDGETGAGSQKLNPSGRDRALSALAGRQNSVVSSVQLFELGFTYEEVRRRVERGILHQLHRGVYAVGHPKLVAKGHLRAALMVCGDQRSSPDGRHSLTAGSGR
jgi:hypothetical protein